MKQVDLRECAAAQADGAQVVDVREPREYAAGHVPGALSIPMGQLPDRLADLDRSRPVYVICQSGRRSAVMAEVLSQHGFDAYNVTGGTAQWVNSRLPVHTNSSTGRGR